MPLRSTSICEDGCESPLPEVRETWSIRGECVSPPNDIDTAVLKRTPGAAGLLPFQDKQCLIMTHEDLFPILSYRIWVDNLYLRAAYHNADRPREFQFIALSASPPLRWPLAGQGKRWITRSTFQGDGLGPTVGLWMDENAYIENCTFANLGGDASPNAECTDCTGNVNAAGVPVRIVNSTFFDILPMNYTNYLRAWGNGSFFLTGCVFSELDNATQPLFYTKDNATIFSDDASIRVRSDTVPAFAVSPVKDVPTFANISANRNYLARTDEWFVDITKSFKDLLDPRPAYPAPLKPTPRLKGDPSASLDVAGPGIPAATDATFPPAPVDRGDLPAGAADSGADTDAGTIVAVAVPIFVLLLTCLAVSGAVQLRRRRLWQVREFAGKLQPEATTGSSIGSETESATCAGAIASLPLHSESLPAGKLLGHGNTTRIPREATISGQPTLYSFRLRSTDEENSSSPRWCTQLHHDDTATPATGDSRQAADVVRAARARGNFKATATSSDAAPSPEAVARRKPDATRNIAHTVVTVTDTCTYGMALQSQKQPEPGAPVTAHLQFLHYQLDRLLGQEVLDGLVLQHGQSNRMQGGQAVIQCAKDRRNGLHYVLKFFVSRNCFNDEAALYTNEGTPLGPFLPQLRNIAGGGGADSAVVDPDGKPLPPCIVMEKGESLDVWMQRNRGEVDMVTGLQVIQHVAERLADLHSAGFVHRDLKLSNIMWLPRMNHWTLIDFGCAARSGECAPLRYSLKYAAPEVVQAVRAGDHTVVTQPSMDAWSLGVVAIELFCKRNVVDMLRSRDQVFACMLDDEPLPWEAGAKGAPTVLRQLGIFQGAVLALLDRDAEWRLGVPEFIARCSSVLERTLGEDDPPEEAHT